MSCNNKGFNNNLMVQCIKKFICSHVTIQTRGSMLLYTAFQEPRLTWALPSSTLYFPSLLSSLPTLPEGEEGGMKEYVCKYRSLAGSVEVKLIISNHISLVRYESYIHS